MLSSILLLTLSVPTPEIARIQEHLLGAERILLRRDLSALTPEQRTNRARAIERLRDYRRGGRFPKNRDFPNRREPYFVDADGTRCAMAHLIEATGERAMVAKIASERNNAYVRDLVDEPGLAGWLDSNGLTVEEAARIQPTYGCFPQASCVCGGFSESPTGTAEVEWKSMPEGMVAEIGAIHGVVEGWQIGDRIEVYSDASVGQRQLALMENDVSLPKARLLRFLTIDASNEIACGQTAVPLAIAAEAAGHSDCVNRLGAVDAKLSNDDHCRGDGNVELGGCTAASGSGQPWILVFVGLALSASRAVRPAGPARAKPSRPTTLASLAARFACRSNHRQREREQ